MPISVAANAPLCRHPPHCGASVCVWEGECVLNMPALNEMDQSVMALLLLVLKPTWTPQHKFLVKDSMDAVKSYLLYS